MPSFNNSKFRIMQITDIQDSVFTSQDTINLIDAALDYAKPDLVIFTGDQFKAYGVTAHIGNRAKNAEKTISNILAPLIKRKVPFIYTYGNHDRNAVVTERIQDKYYRQTPLCLNDSCYSRLGENEVLTFPVYNSEGRVEKVIVLIDSCKKEGGYFYVSDEQMDFLDSTLSELNEEMGKSVSAFIFQHVPVGEMYNILNEVPEGTPESFEGKNAFHKHYYALTDEMKSRGEIMGESIGNMNASSKLFERWVNNGNIRAAFFGHDHNNSFTGTYKGIDLCYAPGAGFNVYGPGMKRGVRIIDFTEGEEGYTTKALYYEDLCGSTVRNKLLFEFYQHAPSSMDAAKPMIRNGSVALAAIASALTTAIITSKRKNK